MHQRPSRAVVTLSLLTVAATPGLLLAGQRQGPALATPPAVAAPSSNLLDGSLLFTQNMDEARALFIDPIAQTQVMSVQLYDALPDICYTADGSPNCFTIGSHHSVIDGHDYLETSVLPLRSITGVIARVPLADPTRTVWRLEQLDFSETSSNHLCRQTCGDAGPTEAACKPSYAHEVIVADEDPDAGWVELVFVEMATSRVSRVHLDYQDGNTCGKVQWTIDSSNPDWPPGASQPNGTQLVEGPEGHFLVTTFLTEELSEQVGGGRVYLWNLDTPEPSLVWRYPEEGTSTKPYLNAVHHGLIQTDPTSGQRYLVYGHSLGASRAWNFGLGGTWGIARIDDLLETPDYLGDWLLPDGYEEIAFSRELEVMPDGSFMGVDAGCYFVTDPTIPCPAQVVWFRPDTLPRSNRPGSFSVTHKSQEMVKLSQESVLEEVHCGLNMLFEADTLFAQELGEELRAAYAAGGTACSE